MNIYEVSSILKERGVNPDFLCIDCDFRKREDVHCIVNEGGWQVFYWERGQKFDERHYLDETSACVGFLDYIEERIDDLRRPF